MVGLADLDAVALTAVAAKLEVRDALALAATCRYAADALLGNPSGDLWARVAGRWGVAGAPVDVAGQPAPSFRAAAVSHQAALGSYGDDGVAVARAWRRLERALDRADASGALRATLAPPATPAALAAAARDLHPSILAYSACHDGQVAADTEYGFPPLNAEWPSIEADLGRATRSIEADLGRMSATFLGGGAVYDQLFSPVLYPLASRRAAGWRQHEVLVLAAPQQTLARLISQPLVEAGRGFVVGARDGVVRGAVVCSASGARLRLAIAPARPGVDPTLATWLKRRAALLERGTFKLAADVFACSGSGAGALLDAVVSSALGIWRNPAPGIEAWPTAAVTGGRGAAGGGGAGGEAWADTDGVVVAVAAVTTFGPPATLIVSYRVRMFVRKDQGGDPATALAAATLESREWVTSSASGDVLDRVAGPGVVGEYPTLTAGGEPFVYASRTATPLARARSGSPDSFAGTLFFKGVTVSGAIVAVAARVPSLTLAEDEDAA